LGILSLKRAYEEALVMKHWQEAQDESLATSGTNMVFTQDGKVALVGSRDRGWRIVTSETMLQAQTALGVDLVLEELEITPLGWS
jgi:hypothetical protein